MFGISTSEVEVSLVHEIGQPMGGVAHGEYTSDTQSIADFRVPTDKCTLHSLYLYSKKNITYLNQAVIFFLMA